MLTEIIIALVVILVGASTFSLGFLLRDRKVRQKMKTAGETAERLLDEAKSRHRELLLEARDEALKIKTAAELELRDRRAELHRQERRLQQKEEMLDRRLESLDRRERSVIDKEKAIDELRQNLEEVKKDRRHELERVAQLTVDEARDFLLREVEQEVRSDAARRVREIEQQAREEADRKARAIITLAIQRCAAEQVSDVVVSVVTLPNEEMKGRIIGREGRNIRALEAATGVDVIIDDTPDTVIISCFDPIRREVARRALEALIVDGRIHPGRIEEIVLKIRQELDTQLVELGEQAAYDTGVHGLHAEIIKLIGRMRYRTSYGQNILEHSKEVAWLAGMMAAELHLDQTLAKRGALLHDIGKVLTHDNEGTHVELGVEVARKYGESAAVINCIQAHHDDVPHESTESVLVQAADAISGSRPGARREAFESYVKRLTRLEEIANAFPGVEKSNVIQAGREIRVVVTPERIDDGAAAQLSESIARKIESELQYPGQIKVVVIRETRAVDFAR